MPPIEKKKNWVECEKTASAVTVRFLTQQIRDMPDIEAIFQQIHSLVARLETPDLVLHFGNIKDIASYAIGKLIVLHNKVKEAGGRLALCCLTEPVAEIIDIMKLRKVLNIYRTEMEALESFG